MFKRLNKPQMPSASQSTPEERTKQEKIRAELQKELDNVVKAAIASPHSRRENVPSEITQNLCNSIEAIFIHGLRDPFFLKGTRYAKYPEPNFWPFVSKFSQRAITNQIACLGQIRSEIGKSRAWIRIVLNESALSEYMDLLASESNAIQQFYSETAFLRLLSDADQSERIRGLLKPLSSLPISAATNSSFLNTWTPTPLILAGLMDGEPLKVGALKARPNPKPAHLTEEIAIPAIDALVPEEDHDIGSPAYIEKKRRRQLSRPIRRSENDDHSDSSSVYSHPSMLDTGEMSYQHAVIGSLRKNHSMPRVPSNHRIQLPQSPLFSSTPVENPTIVDQNSKKTVANRSSDFVQVVSDVAPGYQPLIISRRIRRPSKSKNSSGNDSRSSSGTANSRDRDALETRDSRANSDMPSTIFGTVPNDVAFSLGADEPSKPISVTIDSGITEMTSSSTKSTDEREKEDEEEDEREIQEERSVSFLDALHKLAHDSTDEVIPPPRSLSLTDQFLGDENVEKEPDSEIFDVSMDPIDTPSSSSNSQAPPTSEEPISKPRSQPMAIPGGSAMRRHHFIQKSQPKTDSILGTSLRDELLEALPATDNDTFEHGVPIYVQSPGLMGNSLAAIGARHQMWESMSDRLSSSSESNSNSGPIVSFGQALRSAMETGHHHDASKASSSQDAQDSDESEESPRKVSVSVEIGEKLCQIAREKGLDAQDFRCAMCRKTIDGSTFAKFETCGIDAQYYCSECMKSGGKVPIPARVVMDWDWRERAVSDRGRAWFEANQEKALINLKTTNPKLYKHVEVLRETRKLREKLHLVSMYLFTCRESVAEDFRRRLWPKEYLRSDIDLYSFADLMDVKSGNMQRRLQHLLKHSISHVMNCTLCRQKGFCCEMCTAREVIYPFNTETTHRCGVCFNVFHVDCWKSAEECPKCVRRQNFEARRAQIDDPHNNFLVLSP